MPRRSTLQQQAIAQIRAAGPGRVIEHRGPSRASFFIVGPSGTPAQSLPHQHAYALIADGLLVRQRRVGDSPFDAVHLWQLSAVAAGEQAGRQKERIG